MKKEYKPILISVYEKAVNSLNQLNMLVFIKLSIIACLAVIGCNKTELKDSVSTASGSKNNDASTLSVNDVYGIACTNMANDMIEVYDPSITDWNLSSALKWSWKPNTSAGWSTAEVNAWVSGDPLDVKLRNSTVWSGTSQVIVSVSGNLATIASYPAGVKLWAAIVDPGANQALHQGEVLPNGNAAFAALNGSWVRVYASSQGATNTTYAQVNLTGARGVLWDPIYNVLWAIGTSYIKAYTIAGTAANPTLTEDSGKSFSLTGTGLDITAYHGNPHKFWITKSDGVYLYDKVTKTLAAAAGSANRTYVASMSNHPQGLLAQARPNSTACTLNTWCTKTVDIYNYTGTWSTTRTKNTAAFYRAKYFWDQYQDPVEYRVASYNIRQDVPDPGNQAWTVRRSLVVDMITKYGFDIFGVQEAKGNQVTDLLNTLPDFAKIGTGRDGNSTSEHSAIYYKISRFTVLQSGTFWLSPGAPTTATGPSWDAAYKRICTWGKFKDKSTGLIFWVFNSHFDHQGSQARQESANLVLSQMATKIGTAPAIFTGDLNCNQDSTPFNTLNNSSLLQETWDITPSATRTPTSRQTGNSWNINPPGNSQIDHVFVTSHWGSTKRAVLWDNYNGILPSDHFPVLTWVKIN
ncbi:MAG TPA: endonuclease/exonuclease/phosphatase family protein [Sphingobacteriaceae bacterium]